MICQIIVGHMFPAYDKKNSLTWEIGKAMVNKVES